VNLFVAGISTISISVNRSYLQRLKAGDRIRTGDVQLGKLLDGLTESLVPL
jgi:hypothetical protein